MRAFAAILAMILTAGCVTKPKTYRPPEASRLIESGQTLARRVVAANTEAQRARAAVAHAREAAGRVEARIATITPKLEELFRIAPIELRPLIEAMQSDIELLRSEHAQTLAQMDETVRIQSSLADQLEAANAAKNEVLTEQGAYVAKADLLALSASSENAARVSAEKNLQWYRVRFGMMIAVAGGGGLLWLVFAVIKFSARLR